MVTVTPASHRGWVAAVWVRASKDDGRENIWLFQASEVSVPLRLFKLSYSEKRAYGQAVPWATSEPEIHPRASPLCGSRDGGRATNVNERLR
jgi:hypothetical protein